MNKIMIAAPKSGSGKTMLTCGLLSVLKKRNINVCSYKCGPDYIDPMFHRKVIGIPSRNLDTFFTGENKTKSIFERSMENYEMAVVEGVMGLYDGVGGTKLEGSSYHLAKILNCPIVLVIDVGGMGQSILPLISGFLQWDTEKLIKGIILNRTSKSYGKVLKGMIEEKFDVKVLGNFPKKEKLAVESRHLGLKMPEEVKDIEQRVEQIGEVLEENIDIEELLEISKVEKVQLDNYAEVDSQDVNLKESDFQEVDSQDVNFKESDSPIEASHDKDMELKLAVAHDEAFCFYYQENFDTLKNSGIKIEFFSPLSDEQLPKDIDGILLGGGYPELYLKQLSENVHIMLDIRRHAKAGIPIIAECGGFMYLHEKIKDENEKEFQMVGLVDGITFKTSKLVRFGYVTIKEKTPTFLNEGNVAKGHEFHYFDSTHNGESCFIEKASKTKSWEGIIETENMFLGFPHLYYPQCPDFVKNLIQKMKKYHNKKLELNCTNQNTDKDTDKNINKNNDQNTNKDTDKNIDKNIIGKLYGIGVGPGEENLLTIKALEILKTCDKIIIPTKEYKNSYAYRTIKKFVPNEEEKFVPVDFPMTKDSQKLDEAHDKAFKIMENYLKNGKKLAFITIGDVTVYSTFSYIMKRCRENKIEFELINGIPSFCAVAARLGISLGDKSEQIHIIPGTYNIEDTKELTGTRIYMKSGKKLLKLQEMLQKESKVRKLEVYGVANCSLPTEKVVKGIEALSELQGYLTTVVVKVKEEAMPNSSSFFENRACKYYPCHKNIDKMNCMFCYCPMYFLDKCLGKPEYIEKDGKSIKVCTNCTFSHQPENYGTIMKYLSTKIKK